MSHSPIRILLADDHKMIRESWKVLLENNPRFRVVAVCENGEEAIVLARKLLPDIMLVDLNMSPINGFELTKLVTEELPAVRVIGLSVNNQPKYAIRIVKTGARGYLTKSSTLEEINHGIMEVYKGNIYFCEEIKKHLPPAD